MLRMHLGAGLDSEPKNEAKTEGLDLDSEPKNEAKTEGLDLDSEPAWLHLAPRT